MIATTRVVKKGYDAMARSYENNRSFLAGRKYAQKLVDILPKHASILDVGCGSGSEIDALFIRKGHLVTGIDISGEQISMARRTYPSGNFLVKDMMDLRANEFAVDAVVSFYALFHIPREQHLWMLSTWATYLPKGGWLLVTLGDKDFEGFHELYGERMWSSHFGPEKNREMLSNAGFAVEWEVMDTSANERHQVVLAYKK